MKSFLPKIILLGCALLLGQSGQAQFISAPTDGAKNQKYSPAPTSGPRMSLTTGLSTGTMLKLMIEAQEADIWIDLNNDGIYQEGEAVVSMGVDAFYPVEAQQVSIYGKVKYLRCSNNSISSLTVSTNPELEKLSCGINQIKALDLSGCKNLKMLYCALNQLESLDLTANTLLDDLDCSHNRLDALDVSKNTVLTSLLCSSNLISHLLVHNNPELTVLACDVNELTALDLTQNKKLIRLNCYSNALTSLDLSQNQQIKYLSCSNNGLSALDLKTVPLLSYLTCDANDFEELDLSHCPLITYLSCAQNYLTALDLSQNPLLEKVFCNTNRLTSLDFGNNPKITELWCFENQIRNEAMGQMIESMPLLQAGNNQPFYGDFVVINTTNPEEGNICDKNQVSAAKAKNWKVYDYNGSQLAMHPYEGSEVSLSDITHPLAGRVYPTPFKDSFVIAVADEWIGKTAFLYNAAGNLVSRHELHEPVYRIDASTLPIGHYFLQIGTQGVKLTKSND